MPDWDIGYHTSIHFTIGYQSSQQQALTDTESEMTEIPQNSYEQVEAGAETSGRARDAKRTPTEDVDTDSCHRGWANERARRACNRGGCQDNGRRRHAR
eukprot:6491266-Amphidinium_carterae.2